jgi:phosphinothricin acetyltransferase
MRPGFGPEAEKEDNGRVLSIRDARESDVPTITELYNRLGVGTINSYDLTPVSEANRLAWLRDIEKAGHALLVAELDGKVVGYAGYFAFKQKAGYRHTVEHTIYLNETAQGQGIGKALMGELLTRAERGGIHLMIALINATNTVSLGFHEKLGFVDTGYLPQAGLKFGSFLDVRILCYLFPEVTDVSE